MFGLFGKRELVVDNKPTKEQINKLIEKIHNEFETEVDRILAEAKISVPEIPIDENLLSRANRLRALGFHSAKEIQDVRDWEKKNRDNRWQNEQKRHLVDAVNYFSEKYPNYKFITGDRVLAICQKYSLYKGPVRSYKGHVPESNLKVMELFKVEEADMAHEEVGSVPDLNLSRGMTGGMAWRRIYGPAGLQICAPLSEFDEKLQVDEKKRTLTQRIEIPDPIVLQPVQYFGSTYYLVVTAWGIEAEDNELK